MFFKDKRLIIILLVIVGLSFLVGYSARRENITVGEALINNLYQPIQKVFYQGTLNISDFFQNLFSANRLAEENRRLKEKLAELEGQELLVNELVHENNQLRLMLDFTQTHREYRQIGAQVIGRDPSRWFETVLIDKGSRHGIARHMPVITTSGVVGYIIEVSDLSSKVLLILDNRSAVSGLIQETRDSGVVKGQVDPAPQGHLKMVHIAPDAQIFPGQRVITSGLGGIYPKGLLIGEIVNVASEKQELAQYAILKPSVDLERLEYVFVITNYRGDSQ